MGGRVSRFFLFLLKEFFKGIFCFFWICKGIFDFFGFVGRGLTFDGSFVFDVLQLGEVEQHSQDLDFAVHFFGSFFKLVSVPIVDHYKPLREQLFH